MTKKRGLFLRIVGIVAFIACVSLCLEMLLRNVESWIFMITASSNVWGIFYIFTAFLFTSFFFLAAFSSGTAALFAGQGGYVQSVWNCGIYALICVALFASLQLFTGLTEDDVQIFIISVVSIVCLIVFNAIVFFCLKEEETFYWKKIAPTDENTKLCLKVYILMTVVTEIATFIYAHKVID